MTVPLGSLIDDGTVEITTGFASGDHNQDGVGIPHMRPFNVTADGRVSLAQVKSVPESEGESRLLVPGDVLFNNTNTSDWVGKTAYWDREGKYAFSNHMTRLRVRNTERVSPRYLALALHREWLAGQAKMLCRQHVAQASIIGERFRELSIHLPLPAVQQRIAAVLTSVENAMQVEERAVALARELKTTARDQVFSRGMRGGPLKDTEIGPLPSSWDVQPFSAFREFLQYGTSAKCDYIARGNPVLRIPNVVEGHIFGDDLKWCQLDQTAIDALLLERGDVLFIRTNGVRERVGSCAVYDGEPASALFASYLIRARLRTQLLNPRFLQHYTETPSGASFLAGRASPAADGKFNVNTKTIDAMLVPLPTPGEQAAIVETLGSIADVVRVHERKRRSLSGLFASLLDALVAGEGHIGGASVAASSAGVSL